MLQLARSQPAANSVGASEDYASVSSFPEPGLKSIQDCFSSTGGILVICPFGASFNPCPVHGTFRGVQWEIILPLSRGGDQTHNRGMCPGYKRLTFVMLSLEISVFLPTWRSRYGEHEMLRCSVKVTRENKRVTGGNVHGKAATDRCFTLHSKDHYWNQGRRDFRF